MAEEDEGAIWADWAMGAEGADGAMGSEGVMGAEEDKGAAIYLIIEHYGNRLYGFMGLRSKMLEWSGLDGVDWIPLRLLRLLEHLRC